MGQPKAPAAARTPANGTAYAVCCGVALETGTCHEKLAVYSIPVVPTYVHGIVPS